MTQLISRAWTWLLGGRYEDSYVVVSESESVSVAVIQGILKGKTVSKRQLSTSERELLRRLSDQLYEASAMLTSDFICPCSESEDLADSLDELKEDLAATFDIYPEDGDDLEISFAEVTAAMVHVESQLDRVSFTTRRYLEKFGWSAIDHGPLAGLNFFERVMPDGSRVVTIDTDAMLIEQRLAQSRENSLGQETTPEEG